MDRDLKHNKLAGEIKRRNLFGGHSEEISRLINDLEKLRPRHIYGTGRNGSCQEGYFLM